MIPKMPPIAPRNNDWLRWLAPVAGGAAWVAAQKALGQDMEIALAGGVAFLVTGLILLLVSYWWRQRHPYD